MRFLCQFEATSKRKEDYIVALNGYIPTTEPSVAKNTAIIVFLKTSWLAEAADKSWGGPQFRPDDFEIKQASCKNNYRAGNRFDPPQIGCPIDSPIFVEGRNRSIAADLLGIKTIPVLIPKDHLSNLDNNDAISGDPSYQNFDFSEIRKTFPNLTVLVKLDGKITEI